jgi:fermentation-respiration switch protein FrsA (DUF1100 family)
MKATDDLRYSPVPNLIMVNSAVYDLTDQNTAWIRKDLTDKDLVKSISPNFLVHGGLPPMLAIHGTSDGNVPFATAEKFKDEMVKAGNKAGISSDSWRAAFYLVRYEISG